MKSQMMTVMMKNMTKIKSKKFNNSYKRLKLIHRSKQEGQRNKYKISKNKDHKKWRRI